MSTNSTVEQEVIDLTAFSDDSDTKEITSDASDIEIQLNAETRSQLKSVINDVSEARLRQVLIGLIETEQAIEMALTRELVTLNRETRSIVPRWEVCGNCKEEFDTNTSRDEEECEYHEGEMEADDDAFADWDEDVHGPIYREDVQNDYPENFTWTCCNENGRSPGCIQGEHQPSVPRKRRRL